LNLAATATRACPQCRTPLTSLPDERGLLLCSQCGARLRVRAATPLKRPVAATPPAPLAAGSEALMGELRALRAQQDQVLASLALILEALSARDTPAASDPAWSRGGLSPEPSPEAEAPSPPPRTRRRQKTALLVDDDPDTRDAALTALGNAQVPVKAVSQGNDALAAIASEKPDVIILELEIAGAMSGRDVVNMIKATMEWVDVPIVLYTRSAIASQKEARQIHGGDEYVAKGPASAEALVARVISIFQKGH
jgi:CheY-like chemotaxis protein